MSHRVMLVEDDKTTSIILEKYIESLGYTLVYTATSGEEAIENISHKKPDLVLMDITLEGDIDGIEAAEKISELNDVPVIYITSSSDKKTLERAKITNPFGYIIKPINKRELKASMDMAILRYDFEKTLKENEDRFSTILNSIGDAVVVVNSKGIITYINPVAEIMTGYTIDEAPGNKLQDIISIENTQLESMKGIDDESSIDSKIITKEHNFLISKQKYKRPVDYSVAPLISSKGSLAGTVMVLRDITERVKSEEQLQDSIEQLRKTMGAVIEAMERTVETRDPYTAGHQRRVADLASAIAGEMNLPNTIIEGVRMAGIIHDLGKISIPAEILSKPGRLTEIEFNLIKIHPEVGYEILKSIDFPWPVAEIVYQHHEKIDGSGYPRGLLSNNILIEAKIMTVADVVEAMASHRPYRAALGIERALDEIAGNKGVLYDPDVVETCINLFRNGGYCMDYH